MNKMSMKSLKTFLRHYKFIIGLHIMLIVLIACTIASFCTQSISSSNFFLNVFLPMFRSKTVLPVSVGFFGWVVIQTISKRSNDKDDMNEVLSQIEAHKMKFVSILLQ